jgi:hypothetical protein
MRSAPILRLGPMRLAPQIFLLAIGLALSLGAAAGRAGALVEFPNVSEQAPTKLLGYLTRPDSGLSAMLGSHSNRAGTYSAVVVLHGCGGLSSHSAKIADQMGFWGMWLLLSTVSARAASPATAAVCSSTRRSMPTRRCATCRGWISSIRRGWPCSANPWADCRRSTQSIATWSRNISTSAFAQHPRGQDDGADHGPDRGGGRLELRETLP